MLRTLEAVSMNKCLAADYIDIGCTENNKQKGVAVVAYLEEQWQHYQWVDSNIHSIHSCQLLLLVEPPLQCLEVEVYYYADNNVDSSHQVLHIVDSKQHIADYVLQAEDMNAMAADCCLTYQE